MISNLAGTNTMPSSPKIDILKGSGPYAKYFHVIRAKEFKKLSLISSQKALGISNAEASEDERMEITGKK